MRNKNLIYLVLSLGISSATLLINRFVVLIPSWLAIILAGMSILFLVIFIVKNRVLKKQD